MIAQNIAIRPCLAGHHVLFTTAAQLLLDLGAQESARGLARRLQHYSQPALLVVDEVGYLSYDSRAADLLFQVVGRRYEKKSLALTTNLPFSDWPSVFPNAATRHGPHRSPRAPRGDHLDRRHQLSSPGRRDQAEDPPAQPRGELTAVRAPPTAPPRQPPVKFPRIYMTANRVPEAPTSILARTRDTKHQRRVRTPAPGMVPDFHAAGWAPGPSPFWRRTTGRLRTGWNQSAVTTSLMSTRRLRPSGTAASPAGPRAEARTRWRSTPCSTR